jgi:hypothetical protein
VKSSTKGVVRHWVSASLEGVCHQAHLGRILAEPRIEDRRLDAQRIAGAEQQADAAPDRVVDDVQVPSPSQSATDMHV